MIKCGLAILILTSLGQAAFAENTGKSDPSLLLDAIKTFGSLEAAQQACGKDHVVWADRYEGYYYESREPKFGTTAFGSYACRQEAEKGKYWDTGPSTSFTGHPGRNFPFTPLFIGS